MRSINCARLIDFLLVEHMNHAGTENGNLTATYKQLQEWGIWHRHIRPAINEAVFLGLLRVEKGGYFGGKTEGSLYRLTFYTDKNGSPPTNEWKCRDKDAIRTWKRTQAKNTRAKKQNSGPLSCTNQGHFRVLDGGKRIRSET
jgi:hypothetical protein